MVQNEYPFIIRELAEECKDQFECLGENMEKYITFQYQSKKNMIMVKHV